jgi:hypothetical protein
VAIASTALMRDRADAVTTNGNSFNLELEVGLDALRLGQGPQLTSRPPCRGASPPSKANHGLPARSFRSPPEQGLEVIGNNIANANTTAPRPRTEFADVYANAIGGSQNAIASASTSPLAQQFTQGNITAPTTCAWPWKAAASSRCVTRRAR